jgi:hypothetical protein
MIILKWILVKYEVQFCNVFRQACFDILFRNFLQWGVLHYLKVPAHAQWVDISREGGRAIVTVDIPRARLPQHCYEKKVTALSDTWKSNCASSGSETNFFPPPGTVTECRDPCRIPGNNCHNNNECPIRDICFTQFTNVRCQELFYMCSTSSLGFYLPAGVHCVPITVSIRLVCLWLQWIADSAVASMSVCSQELWPLEHRGGLLSST